jgi:hypothetical protein
MRRRDGSEHYNMGKSLQVWLTVETIEMWGNGSNLEIASAIVIFLKEQEKT